MWNYLRAGGLHFILEQNRRSASAKVGTACSEEGLLGIDGIEVN